MLYDEVRKKYCIRKRCEKCYKKFVTYDGADERLCGICEKPVTDEDVEQLFKAALMPTDWEIDKEMKKDII